MATKRQLEQLKAEDVNFEDIMEINDSNFSTNLQDPLTLSNIGQQNVGKIGSGTRIKPG